MNADSAMTLREICDWLHISRRAVQGYEAHALVSPSGKNPMGHLFYDEDAQQRIRRICRYQKYGFSLKEITRLLDAPADILRGELEKRLAALCEHRRQTDAAIEELRNDIAQLK